MYRTIDCGIWHDEWMQTLSAEAKYLFIYLFTNHRATACGVYELTPGAMARETGLTLAAVTAALAELAPKVQYWPDLDVVWVVNFYRHQRANSNARFAASARRTLAQFPAALQATVWDYYPELNPTPNPPPPATNPISDPILNGISSPIPNKDNSDQITVISEQASASATEAAFDAIAPAANHTLLRIAPTPKPTQVEATVAAYAAVVAAYPLRLGVLPDYDAGLAAFAAKSTADYAAILAGVQAFAAHPDATKDQGQYVMGIDRFISGDHWKRYKAAPPARRPMQMPAAPEDAELTAIWNRPRARPVSA